MLVSHLLPHLEGGFLCRVSVSSGGTLVGCLRMRGPSDEVATRKAPAKACFIVAERLDWHRSAFGHGSKPMAPFWDR